MKRIIETTEAQGLDALLGEHVAIWCECYIYAGKLTGVNDDDIILEGASIVYETGELSEPGFARAERLPGSEWRVRTSKIESYGAMS